MTNFTVIICTHNRARLLKIALDALRDGQTEQVDFDVLVVANACSDNTESLLTDYAQQWPVLSWVREPIPGKSHALNHAIKVFKTPVAVFIDDDQRAARDFPIMVQAALDSFPDVGILCGRLLPDWDGSEPDWLHDQGPYRIYPPPVAAYEAGTETRLLSREKDVLPPGGNLVIRHHVFERVGQFATELGPQGHNLLGGEDIELLHRALAAGEQIVYVPGILQYHAILPEHLTVRYLVRKSYQRTRSALRIKPRAEGGIPLYLWKKCLVYGTKVLTSLASEDRRRFYLVRLAAVVGEIQGLREAPVHRTSR